jgi:hypothetical protein
MLGYIAVRNWAQPWDDGFHNHFLYQRASDGKWLLIPQDKDREFGEQFGWAAGRTFYTGEAGGAQYNRLKDAFIKAFRAELIARLVITRCERTPEPSRVQEEGHRSGQYVQHHRLRIFAGSRQCL